MNLSNLQEALTFLDRVSSSVETNREGHVNIQTAVATLQGLVLRAEADTRTEESARPVDPQVPKDTKEKK